VDGIYGPETIDAVKALQTQAGLPVTGYVDQATALALDTLIVGKGGALAAQALVTATAVQTALKLAGYWSGPVDGQWTDGLTQALKAFQQSLGVPATGEVDGATLEAIYRAIRESGTPPTTTTAPQGGATETTAVPGDVSTTTG
jgi:peptidoglycan hydrolase-like protein with peptidoglycan-binding domain